MELDEAFDLLDALEREEVEYALIGSMALAAHGIVRATRDIDFFVRPEEANLERLKRALRSVFGDPAIEAIVIEDLAGAFPVIRYGPPHGRFVIDLVGRLGDAFSFDDIEHAEIEVAGTTIRVATPQTLYRMKRDTMRLQDRVDAERLRERFGLKEEP